jgi:hypothetical protein
MKVCGFTIIRNAIKYGYPVAESIQSILPICDKVVVAVGESEDDTLELIKSIDPNKIEIVKTIWDDSLRQGGKVLAIETDKAFDAVSADFDWCVYIQADEVLHEKDYPEILGAMRACKDDAKIEGLLFKYLHFWGTYDYVGVSRNWYRHEIRVVKNDKSVRSYKDAQGFRKHGRKLQVKKIDATVFHYGYVRSPEVIKRKISNFHSLYYDGERLEKELDSSKNFDYSQINAVRKFEGAHPQIMKSLISRLNWHVDVDPSKAKFSLKERILFAFEKVFKYRLFEYKNYSVMK